MKNKVGQYPLEPILHRAHIHPYILCIPICFILLGLIYESSTDLWLLGCKYLFLFTGICMAASRTLVFADSDHKITATRFYFRKGMLNRKSRFILIEDIERVTIYQSFAGKMLDYGTINIQRKGTIHSFHYITEPAMCKLILEELISTYKQS